MSGKKEICLFLLYFFVPQLFSVPIEVHTVTHQSKSLVEPITAVFSVQPKQSVLGQELLCTLLVTYDPRRISIRGLEMPKYDDNVFCEPLVGPQRSQIEVNGQQMIRLTWSMKVYSRQAGRLHLPGITVEYGRIDERREGFGGIFSLMFQQDERMYKQASNDLIMTIAALPAYATPVSIVGEYNACLASVDRSLLKQGDAAVLTIALHGRGNAGFDKSFSPRLPAGCVSYLDEIKRTNFGAIFRFVVQCNLAGKIEIPSQKFIFYNPHSKRFDLICSDPLTIEVTPSAVPPSVDMADEQMSKVSGEQYSNSYCDCSSSRDVSLLRSFTIPRTLFLFYCVLVMLVAICFRWRSRLKVYLVRTYFLIRRRYALYGLWRSSCRNDMTVDNAYLFFHTYTVVQDNTEKEDWVSVWSMLQERYFNGEHTTILSPKESERVLFWARRVPLKKIFFSVVVLGCVFLQASEIRPTPQLGEQVHKLRLAQRHASISDYDVIEKNIAQIKQAENKRSSLVTERMMRFGHIFPLVIWQLIFLCGLGLVWWRRTRILGIIFLLFAGIALLYAEYERSESWRYILVNTKLYLGPGSGYPVRKGVSSGDEVRVIRYPSEKVDSWKYVDACGEKGWLPHDVFV